LCFVYEVIIIIVITARTAQQQETGVHSASEAFAMTRYINCCFTYLLTYRSFQDSEKKSFSGEIMIIIITEIKEPNPHSAAGNARQTKVINQAKTAHLVLGSMM